MLDAEGRNSVCMVCVCVCTHVHVSVHAGVCTCVWVCIHMASGQWWASSSIALHLTLEVGSFLYLELAILQDWLASESLDPPISASIVLGLQCEL